MMPTGQNSGGRQRTVMVPPQLVAGIDQRALRLTVLRVTRTWPVPMVLVGIVKLYALVGRADVVV